MSSLIQPVKRAATIHNTNKKGIFLCIQKICTILFIISFFSYHFLVFFNKDMFMIRIPHNFIYLFISYPAREPRMRN